MSAAVYISFESPTTADQIVVDGKHMMLHLDNVSAIGEDHGLKRLDDYVSQTMEEVLDFMDDAMASQEQIITTYHEQWFDPKEGLALIEEYIGLIGNYHSLGETIKSKCLIDLKSYREVLRILTQENIRWHFSYDI